MTPNNRPKPLFKVASEFNVSTQSIVDALSEKGFEVSNKPNFKVTPEMYGILEGIYGEDKAKSLEHERARDEYENRRNAMLNQRNDSVTVDSFLEPMDDLMDELEPQDEAEAKKQESVEPSLEPQDEADGQKQVEPELEPEEEPDIEVKAAEEEVEEVAETEAEANEADQVAEQESEPEEEEEVAEAETKSEEDEEDDDEEEEEVAEAEDESIIRGKADKLKGPKVLGKASFTQDEKKPVRRKKRKRRKDRKQDEAEAQTPDVSDSDDSQEENKDRRKKKKGKTSRKARVDETDVERKMRETMQAMQGGANVGSKRAKRRRQRKEEREEIAQQQAEMEEMQEGILEVTEFITASDLADLLNVNVNDIIMKCMGIGMMISINQRLDAATIELVVGEYGKEVDFVDAEELVDDLLIEEEDEEEDLLPRSPIITVMGHVDHGKTSLLDYIREAKVAEGEAGGITQHVGAYEVMHNDKRITFLDTPGHEAFTAMRSRGAQVTDIVILVVAADDSVMPQTIEAINHAKAAGVPIVVAINKVDKPEASPDKIRQQLSDYDVVVEEWGGSNQAAEVSAKTGFGIDDLLEKVLIEAELQELKANPDRPAVGIVLEAKLDKGKGTVANVLIQNGTLNVGDPFVAGPVSGKVRAMEDEHGKRIKEAGPSTPIQMMGFDEMPQAGDRLVVTKDEKTSKEVANQRMQIRREQALRKTKHLTLDDLSRRLALGEVSELNLIIKADVDGSIEALSGSLQKLSNEEVAVNIIHTGAGAINESDVLLASASEAIIIGFQVRPTAQARKLAESEEIDIRLFSVIYDAVDEVRDALEGLLSPEIKEKMAGIVEVREVFRVSKVGTIAGCYVTEGKIERNNPIRVIRDGVVIYDGNIDSLKRFKDDVKEVASGYECGISIVNYNDIKVGDVFESYVITEEKRKLEDTYSNN